MSENFLEDRKTGIGGSDIGAICGVNPYKRAADVYLEKIGEKEPEPENDAMHWGNLLEPLVVEESAKKIEQPIAIGVPMKRHEDYPFLIAHVDGLLMPESKTVKERVSPYFMFSGKPLSVFEAKTAGGWASRQFGPSYSNELPETYILQGQHYLNVWGLNKCIFGVLLLSDRDLRLYEIKRDDKLIKNMITIANDFWEHVQKREMPSYDDSESYSRAIASVHKDTGEIITVDDEAIIDHTKRLKYARVLIDEYKKEKTLHENAIKEYLTKHNASGLEIPNKFRVTWKKSKPIEKIDWQAVAKGLSVYAHTGEYEKLIEENTKIREGSHRFLPKWSDEDE